MPNKAPHMMSDEEFFYAHAGYSYDPKRETPEQGRRRCAKALARAEDYAQSLGWTFKWDHEPDADLSWMDEEERAKPHEVLCCVLRDASGDVRASLGNIVDADRNYGRVVEAELALEAMPGDVSEGQ